MRDSNDERRRKQELFFDDANLQGEPSQVTSPSGRYRLTIRTYRTGPHTWSYARGTVVRIADGTQVCDIKRNLGEFHHSFVTKDACEYLITGRSYMSQTIVNLDHAVETEPVADHYDGAAFCWAACYLSPNGNTLAVDGCIWACPYEVRFFDFSDPTRGWPALPIVGAECVEDPSDVRKPTWLDARTVECHHADTAGEPQERTRLERRGHEMHVVDHWVSDALQASRAEQARADAALDTWWATFRMTDPMYLRLVKRIRGHAIPGDTLDYRPGARRIVQYFRRVNPHASADLKWDLDAATILVRLYDAKGNHDRDLTFAGTLAGMDAAITEIVRAFA